MAFITVMSTTSGRGGASKVRPLGVRLVCCKGGTEKRKNCAITIGDQLVRRMRWVDQDRIQVQFDTESRMVRLARIVDGKSVVLRLRHGGAARTSVTLRREAMDILFPGNARQYEPTPVTESAEGLLFPWPS